MLSHVYAPPTSKMFYSGNSLPLKETQSNESKAKLDEEILNVGVKKSETLNENKDDNFSSIVIQPNHNIPKTIYYKRLCQKLVQQNESKNILKHNENSTTTFSDKIPQSEKEELSNDNILKEMSSPSIHNISKDNLNSTLVICESDVTPSDCELDTTPVNPCENLKKGKENVLSESFFSDLKQPLKLKKKKLVIAPATIGVNKTLNVVENSIKNKYLESKILSKKNELLEKQMAKPLNNTTLIEEHSTNRCDSSGKQLPTTDKIYNQKPLNSENNNQVPLVNIEVEQIPFRRKTVKLEKKDSSPPLAEIKKSSNAPNIHPPVDYELNSSIKSIKYLPVKNDEKLSCLSKTKENKLKCQLPINPIGNFTKSLSSNDNNLTLSPKNVEPLSVNTEKKLSNSLEPNHPLKPKLPNVDLDCNLIKFSPHNDNDISTSIKNDKCLSVNKKKDLPTSLKELLPSNNSVKYSSKNKLVEPNSINNADMPSINIEVEQGSIFRRSNVRKVIMHSSSIDNKQDTKKGRRVQLITIKDHFSQPLPSFNGAKKIEIDVSKKSVHIEKVVESSSLFHVPQVKRRRTMNFSNADS